MGVSICLKFFYFVKRKNTKHLTKWVSATFGILTPRSTAKALAPAERSATGTVLSVSTASTCAVNASINTPRTSGSRRWTEEGKRRRRIGEKNESREVFRKCPSASYPDVCEGMSPEISRHRRSKTGQLRLLFFSPSLPNRFLSSCCRISVFSSNGLV